MISALKKNSLRRDLDPSEIEKEQLELASETRYQKVTNYVRAIFVRIFFLAASSFYIAYLIGLSNSYFYMFLIIGPFIVIADGLYVVFKRRGKELSW